MGLGSVDTGKEKEKKEKEKRRSLKSNWSHFWRGRKNKSGFTQIQIQLTVYTQEICSIKKFRNLNDRN